MYFCIIFRSFLFVTCFVSSFLGGYSDPGPSQWFASFYKEENGAKISNASWGSSHRDYSFRCRNYDQALYEQYSDILMVVSAGNAGNDVPDRPMNTIEDPGSCKNVLTGK